MAMRIQFLGSGDAFGHGGRLQTCMLLEAAGQRLLLDCGATALISMRRQGIAPNDIGTILVTHFHGDHYGGLPFFILDAQLFSRRATTLTVAGPPGLPRAMENLMEAMFSGSYNARRKFDLELVELEPGRPYSLGGLEVVPFLATHAGQDVRLGYRLEADGRRVAYTGDSGWSESLAEAVRGVDLLIAEAFFFDKKLPDHLDYATLAAHRDALAPGRLLLTHMSRDMLDHLDGLEVEAAEDGLVVTV